MCQTLLIIVFTEFSDDDEQKAVPSKRQRKSASAKTAVLKEELRELLLQPLITRGVSTRYITSGSKSIADDMLSGQCEYLISILSVIFTHERYRSSRDDGWTVQ